LATRTYVKDIVMDKESNGERQVKRESNY
jgi:hypothetical protein